MILDGGHQTIGGSFVFGLLIWISPWLAAQENGANDTKKQPAAALSIALDPGFGTGGFVADFLEAKEQTGALGRFLAVDSQNRPVIAGNSPGQKFSIGRYTSEGRPDLTFAGKGKHSVCIEDNATVESAGNTELQFTHGGTIDAKGRVVIIGKGGGIGGERKWDFALLRFLPNGLLDKTFSEVGYRKFQAHEEWNIGLAVATAPDCSVVAAGYAKSQSDPLLIRFHETGEVDEKFSATANGSLRWLIKEGTPAMATSVAIDAQGRFLVGMNLVKERWFWSLARLKPDGEIDDSFGDQGLWSKPLDPNAQIEMSFSNAVDAQGRIVMGGYSADGSELRRLAVARLTQSGHLDADFGPDGNGYVIVDGYGANVDYRYGPRAAVGANHIAITGPVNGAKGNIKCFGLAVMDGSGKNIAKIEPRLFPGSKGTDQPWGVAFDSENRVVVGGASQAISSKFRFADARYVLK